jgi:aspartyl-tRNA(Asn)/glutamyl-tRNA(Gln) amidotransferase subunit B
MNWKLKIGLEIHAQLNTKSKLFSSARNEYSDMPNEQVAPLDIACPGALPILNQNAVRKAICAGKILNCNIEKISKFDRKHYRYPDLPLGYQITQFFKPICTNGLVALTNKTIRINRIHIETDAGKLIHHDNEEYIDYNRCGCPLIEIVTEPDFSSAVEVTEFLTKLVRDLEYGNVSDCNMEKGNLRCDINISIYNDKENSERVEVKNVNSIEFVRNAIEYEYNRQVELMKRKEYYTQHTRGYSNGITTFMRSKETFREYRYWPCGNLPTLRLEQSFIDSVIVPETYDIKYAKYMEIINNKEVVNKVLSDIQICIFFENSIQDLPVDQILLFANLLACDLMGLCINGLKPYDCNVTMDYLIKIVKMNKSLPIKVIKLVLKECFETGKDPEQIVKDKKLTKITDESVIREFLRRAYDQDEDAFKKFANGDMKVKQAIIGMMMKFSGGQADMSVIEMLLEEYKKTNKGG